MISLSPRSRNFDRSGSSRYRSRRWAASRRILVEVERNAVALSRIVGEGHVANEIATNNDTRGDEPFRRRSTERPERYRASGIAPVEHLTLGVARVDVPLVEYVDLFGRQAGRRVNGGARELLRRETA